MIESDSLCIKKDVAIGGTWANDTIYSKWFEFVNVNDEYITVSEGGVDTQQLNPNPTNNLLCFKQVEAMANGSNGCTIEFKKGYYQVRFLNPYTSPNGTYDVDGQSYQVFSPFTEYPYNPKQSYLCFNNIDYIKINLNGAKLKSLQHIYPRWSFIFTGNIKNVLITNGEIEGFAAQFDYPQYYNSYNSALLGNYECGFGIQCYSVSSVLTNLKIHNLTGDGIAIGSYRISPTQTCYCNDYTIDNCEVSYCGRNGISLTSSNYATLTNNLIHHIGSDGGNGVIGSDNIKGQNPRSGIDVEFEDALGLHPIMIWSGLNIHDCGVNSITLATIAQSTTKSFLVQNSSFEGRIKTNANSITIPVFNKKI